MLKKGNENGYTLLIVLFVVTFIMIISASFVTASVSNAKQEKVVDTNNMAVVAAEMGVDYYKTKLQIEEQKAYKETKNKIFEAFHNCMNNPNPNCTNEAFLIALKDEIIDENYLQVLNDKLANWKGESSPVINSADPSISYTLSDYENLANDGDKVVLQFTVDGSSSTKTDVPLLVRLNFNLPSFLEIETIPETENENTNNPGDGFDYFWDNFQKVNPCIGQNNCQDGNFYTEGNIEIDNANNQSGMIWVHDGFLITKNINSAKFTLIVKSLNSKNSNSMDGKLILLGEKKLGVNGEVIKGVLKFHNKIQFESNGKVCINIDGYTKNDIENLEFQKISNSNQLLFYSSSPTPAWPNNVSKGEKRTGLLTDFINECAGEHIVDYYNDSINYKGVDDDIDFEVDVEY